MLDGHHASGPTIASWSASVPQIFHEINPLADSRWGEFLHRHARASIFHTPGWLEALQRTYGYEPVVFTTSRPGEQTSDLQVFRQLVCRLVLEKKKTQKKTVAYKYSLTSQYVKPLDD